MDACTLAEIRVAARNWARALSVSKGINKRVQTLPLGKLSEKDLAGQFPISWLALTHGYGKLAITAAALAGSGVDGRAVTLPHCEGQPCNYFGYAGRVRPYEYQSILDFGREIHTSAIATITRTAVAVGLALPYSRDGVINGISKVSKAYIETLLILSGRCTDELFDRAGKPLLSLLLKVHRSGGDEAVRDKVEVILDWYSPRYLANVLRVLDWYERFILSEIRGCSDRRSHASAA